MGNARQRKILVRLPPLAWLRSLLSRLMGEPKRWLLGAGLVVFATVLLSSNFGPDHVSLEVGDRSTDDIRAHRTVEFVDAAATAQLRDEAAQSVQERYKEDRYAAQDAEEAATDLFDQIPQVRDAAPRNPLRQARLLRSHLMVDVPLPVLADLTTADAHLLGQLRSATVQLIRETMDEGIRDRPNDLPRARRDLIASLGTLSLQPRYRLVVAQVAPVFLRPNRLQDRAGTEAMRQEERRSVAPVRRQILRGDIILHRGERAGTLQIEELTALGLRHAEFDLTRALLLALLLAALILVASFILREYFPAIYADFSSLALFAIICAAAVLGLKLGDVTLGLKLSSNLAGYLSLLWIVAASMLVAVLLHPSLGVVTSIGLSVCTGVALETEPRHLFAALISSLVGVCSVARIRDRHCLVRIGATLAVTNVALIWLLDGLTGDLPYTLAPGGVWGVAAGVGSALILWLGVALLERPFGITTHIGLLELSDPNRPILRDLLMKAPGTYHHSMVVGSLAEAAAESVGADSLLVRVCAYYHDIGKMRRPEFFAENQRLENVHDQLNPTLSVLVITSHVREGVQMARECRLPAPIVDGIREHHGTCLVKYFYHQALGERGPSNGLEQHFRYDGPKPRSKETALLMLADGVEAASRSLSKPTPGKIEGLVHKIIGERLADGQLDECDLTFRDISKIASSFVRTLTGMLHARIEYPDIAPTPSRRPALHVVSDSKAAVGSGESAPLANPGHEAAAL